ncbi:uncharacterized protein [Chiloscyllium punctatum]|uniref:uncharacterized protein n=1 Tax=Chiloscyllium punctatum TaxID=137246 RepID=UPI003B636413
MPGTVIADLFERAVCLLPFLPTFQRQKRLESNSKLERLFQNFMILIMVFILLLFANDVFDVGYYVVCYENDTLVRKKDASMCVENMKPENEPQAPEYLTLIIGIFLGVMFIINRLWEFYFQSFIREHLEEIIFEINDSVYRAMMVNIGEGTSQCTDRNSHSIYKEDLALQIDDISPIGNWKCHLILVCFIIKNAAYCALITIQSIILSNLLINYEEEKQQCQLEHRRLDCTIPEYHTLKYIGGIANACTVISFITIITFVFCTLWKVNSKFNSFLDVYNCDIIPHYSYQSLTLHSQFSAWGIILLYLKENDCLLVHYRYLNSMCNLLKICKSEERHLLSKTEHLKLLKRMKLQVLIDEFSRDLSGPGS